MNEADTRAQLIDPQLTTSGWGIREGARIWREYSVSRGRILAGWPWGDLDDLPVLVEADTEPIGVFPFFR